MDDRLRVSLTTVSTGTAVTAVRWLPQPAASREAGKMTNRQALINKKF